MNSLSGQIIRFEDHSEEAKNGLLDREKQAFRAAAKLLKNASKERVPVRSGDLQKVIATWVRVQKKTGRVWLQLGVYNASAAKRKKLTPAGTRAHLVEFGSVHNRAVSFLRDPTYENVEAIRKLQAQYLPDIVAMPDIEDTEEEIE